MTKRYIYGYIGVILMSIFFLFSLFLVGLSVMKLMENNLPKNTQEGDTVIYLLILSIGLITWGISFWFLFLRSSITDNQVFRNFLLITRWNIAIVTGIVLYLSQLSFSSGGPSGSSGYPGGIVILGIILSFGGLLGLILSLRSIFRHYFWNFIIISIIISIIFPYIGLFFIVYIFHFYSIKSMNDGKASTILDDFFAIFQSLFSPINKKESGDKTVEANGAEKTLDLMSSLSQVDISNIISITFLPSNSQGFTIKTPNIKRLSVYITTKLGKTTFEGEELRKAFDHVIANISSDLSKTDFNLIQGKINEFVKSGGEVIMERK